MFSLVTLVKYLLYLLKTYLQKISDKMTDIKKDDWYVGI